MADRSKVSQRDGAHRMNTVGVEPGYFLAPGYMFAETEDREIGDTGRIKVFRVAPSSPQSEGPRFLGRWDDGPAQCLDFDVVDEHDHVLGMPYGHHPERLTPDGPRRYLVELGRDKESSFGVSCASRWVSGCEWEMPPDWRRASRSSLFADL